MADLLECLIQINALGETLQRIARLKGGAEVSACWEQLAQAERRYAAALAAATSARPDIGPEDPVTKGARAEFAALRGRNLALLDRCTATQLAGPVDWPGRRSTTVADLVAIMLAADTEVLGELRRGGASGIARIPNPESRIPGPGA